MSETSLPRRRVVALVGGAVALPLLAACGKKYAAATNPAPSSPHPTRSASTPSAPGRTRASARSHASAGGPVLASATDVPVGGAVVVAADHVVVTQPTKGQFKCFGSACTHAGCTVTAGSPLVCPCHGSEFSIKDGSVIQGPATAPLPEHPITVSGGEIHLA